MTLGSTLWGQIANLLDIPTTLLIAAGGAALAIPATWRWKLQQGVGQDFSPSMHWPAPITSSEVEPDRGPVMITVEYRIAPENRAAFLSALAKLEPQRRRDGAYSWGVFEDTEDPEHILEYFLVVSWIEHMRQHERVTNAD